MTDWLSHMCLMLGGENPYTFWIMARTVNVAILPQISALYEREGEISLANRMHNLSGSGPHFDGGRGARGMFLEEVRIALCIQSGTGIHQDLLVGFKMGDSMSVVFAILINNKK
jgi:hypothetical protein